MVGALYDKSMHTKYTGHNGLVLMQNHIRFDLGNYHYALINVQTRRALYLMEYVHDAYQIKGLPFRIVLVLDLCPYLIQFQSYGMLRSHITCHNSACVKLLDVTLQQAITLGWNEI